MKAFVPKTLAAAVIAWALLVVSAPAVEWAALEGLTPPPAGFLRFEGALAEPGDPIIRIDGLPGG